MNARHLVVFLLSILILAATPWPAPAADDEVEDDRPVWGWVPQSPPYWPRYYHGAVVHDGRMWIMGGLSINNWLNDVWSTADGVNWELAVAEAAWSTRAKFELVSFKGRMYVLGGFVDAKGGDPLTNAVWSSADGKEWQFEGNAPWPARCDFRAEVLHDRLLIMGGHGEWERMNDVWATDDGKNWECLTEAAPWAPRSLFSSVVHDGKLIIGSGLYFDYDIIRVGPRQKPQYGRMNGNYNMRTDTWATEDGRNWTLLEERAAYGGRYQGQWISIGDYIWMMHSGDYVEGPGIDKSIWVSKDGTGWFELSKPQDKKERFDGRSCLTFLWFDNKIWGIAGAHQNWGYVVFDDKTTFFSGNFADPESHRTNKPSKPLPLPGEPRYGKND